MIFDSVMTPVGAMSAAVSLVLIGTLPHMLRGVVVRLIHVFLGSGRRPGVCVCVKMRESVRVCVCVTEGAFTHDNTYVGIQQHNATDLTWRR